MRSGKMVGLAVGTPTRSRAAPDIPTMVELGYAGFLVPSWNAFFAPARTPANLIARINDINHQALADPKIARMLADQGGETAPSTPEFVTNLMREEYARWKKVISDARIVPE